MTTAIDPRARSAYPPSVDELLPAARALAARIGDLPSKRALRRELRVGGLKADAVYDALAAERTAPEPSSHLPRRLPRRRPLAGRRLLYRTPRPVAAERTPGGIEAPEITLLATAPAALSPAPATDVEPAGAPQIAAVAGAVETAAPEPTGAAPRPLRSWPVLLLALPAFVAIWSGWVGIGGLTGFGVVHPLPGIADGVRLNTAITLPIGVETYAAFALRVWLSGRVPARARRWAKWSAIGSLALGAAGQVAYHLLAARHVTAAPFQVTVLVSCLPVAVLGMGAALAHLMRDDI